jgi:hypothetical protein
LNGVIQKPTDAFTVSGSTITFASNLVTGDVINFIQILGNVLDLGVPSDGTVTSAKITYPLTTFSSTGIDDNADATAMTITSAEKIGIGETSPLGLVHIKTADSGAGANGDADDLIVENGTSGASAGISILSATNGYGAINFGDSGDDNIGIINYDHPNNAMKFFTNGAEAMRINTTDVWIGSTDAFTGQGDKGAFLSSTGGIFDFARIVGGGSSVFRVSGDSGEMRVQGDGDLINTNNSYGAISDRELKENEVEANSQWNDIKALQIKNYNLKATPDIAHLGVIAQDLESSGMNGLVNNTEDELYTENNVLPEGKNIGDIKDKGYKSVKYSVLYMKSIKALQEAMERIETLEAKVTQLENA